MNQFSGNFASFSRRLGAWLIDLLILFIPATLLGGMIPVIGAVLVWFFYAPFLESSVVRATIGKKLMGIQVADLSGGRISFRAGMIRALMKLISSMLFFFPHLLALFTERCQALHDLVADTVVVYGRADVPVVDAWLENTKEVFGSRPASWAGETDRLSGLERLQALYERGALSREEFESEKQKILTRPI